MSTCSEHTPAAEDVTVLLQRWQAGDDRALDELLPAVYADLRALAAQWLRRESGYQTLQPTALLNEVLIRFLGKDRPPINDTEHLFKLSATSMRRILVDRARRAKADRRGGGWLRADHTWSLELPIPDSTDLIALDEVLNGLEALDERLARIVELRYFTGLSVPQVACVLDVDERTVYRDWALARSWLRSQLEE